MFYPIHPPKRPAVVPHCENCGRENPTRDADGYTTCCNECVCYGNGEANFGVPGDSVRACCWAKAEEKFQAAGRAVPQGSHRF